MSAGPVTTVRFCTGAAPAAFRLPLAAIRCSRRCDPGCGPTGHDLRLKKLRWQCRRIMPRTFIRSAFPPEDETEAPEALCTYRAGGFEAEGLEIGRGCQLQEVYRAG